MNIQELLAVVGDLEVSRRMLLLRIAELEARVVELSADENDSKGTAEEA